MYKNTLKIFCINHANKLAIFQNKKNRTPSQIKKKKKFGQDNSFVFL